MRCYNAKQQTQELGSRYFLPREASELERLRRRGTRLFRSLSRDLEDSDPEDEEPEEESESDELLEEPLLESESESEPELDDPELEVERDLGIVKIFAKGKYSSQRTYRFVFRFLLEGSFSLSLPFSSFKRSFSLPSNILFAIPALKKQQC